jgi:hypothetical protein
VSCNVQIPGFTGFFQQQKLITIKPAIAEGFSINCKADILNQLFKQHLSG